MITYGLLINWQLSNNGVDKKYRQFKNNFERRKSSITNITVPQVYIGHIQLHILEGLNVKML